MMQPPSRRQAHNSARGCFLRMGMQFHRSPRNPILTPTSHWWEERAVFNPGVVVHDGRVALVYRAVGADGLSRFGLAWSDDGERIEQRLEIPFYEGALDDPLAQI